MSQALLDIRDLSLHRAGRCLLDGISLRVGEAEIHALLGGNGCGKTSLARSVMGCAGYAPDSGGIRFDGRSIETLSLYERARLGITMAWQEPARFDGVPVRDYLTLRHPDADPAALLRRVGLLPSRYLERMLDETLSGGERKRVELASIAALHPRLALLDEPAAGIDLRSVSEIGHVIEGLRDAGCAVLLISHREEMARIADSASQICGGRIIFSGTAAAVAACYRQHHCVYCDGALTQDLAPGAGPMSADAHLLSG
jgi:Fe-S cluster assembly ATP-binding protein